MNKILTEENVYRKNNIRFYALLIFGIIALILTVGISLTTGNYKTSISEVIKSLINPESNLQIYNIVIYSRIPRLISALIVGLSLAISGLTYQEIFKNKMASPDVLGVSQGASVGAALAIVLSCSFVLTSFISFVGGIIAVMLTLTISQLFKGKDKSISLILSGIVVGGFMSSALGFIKYISNDRQLSSITFWLLGGFYNTTYGQLKVVMPIIVVCSIILFALRWSINMLGHGDRDAKTHGINSTLIRYLVILFSTIITSISVGISGTISWIGLAIPNLVRVIINNDPKRLMSLTIVYGMLFTSICDLLARTLTAFEIPVGIITGCLGSLIFIAVLLVRRFTYGKKTN